MNPLLDKLADLKMQRVQVIATARAITDKAELVPDDRRHFEECIELLAEIQDYADRLQRRHERWRTI